MICLDNNAVIAAFQTNPPPTSAAHRDRVRAFLRSHSKLRVMIPALVLTEYMFPFDGEAKRKEFAELARRFVFIPSFDELTSEIAAELGRRFAAERSLAQVAKQINADRLCVKIDLLIVATAVQHQGQHFITNDGGAYHIAKFAGLNAYRFSDLPDPPPPPPSLFPQD